ncbi:MAG: PAN domain-containing protein [Burkholderiaceae bacterium]
MADEGKGFWQSAPGLLTGAAAVIAAVTGLVVALKPVKATTPGPDVVLPAAPTHAGNGSTTPTPAPPVAAAQDPSQPPAMGPMEPGVGYEGNDLHPNGWLTMGSAQACAKRCYETIPCKAMTYVRSNRSCWLKSAAANRIEKSDEVSAIKR